MKIIDFQEELKNRKGGVLDIQEFSSIEDDIQIKEISRGEETPKIESKSGFATIKPGEARSVISKYTSKVDMPKKDVSIKGIISKEQKKRVISLLKNFGKVIVSNKKIALTVAILLVGSLSLKGVYNSFGVYADTDADYISEFNRSVEDKYSKELENLAVSEGEVAVTVEQNNVAPVTTNNTPSSEQPKTYFSVPNINAVFTEDVKGKHSTYTVSISVSMPTDKISVKVSNVADITYNEEDIEIVSVDIQDSFNREYLGSISVDEKTIKDIESLIEKEKESIREKVYSKSKQEFMSVIDKAIKESINL